jgi:hypothetical protein
MDISLLDARRFRQMNPEEIRCAHQLCRHTETHHDLYKNTPLSDGSRADVMRCRRCFRWWFAGERTPSPGNPALAPFREPCKHNRCRTLPGTDDKNQCLECDAVFDKTDAAIAWRRVRTVTNVVTCGLHGAGVELHKLLRNTLYDSSGTFYWEPPELDLLGKDYFHH